MTAPWANPAPEARLPADAPHEPGVLLEFYRRWSEAPRGSRDRSHHALTLAAFLAADKTVTIHRGHLGESLIRAAIELRFERKGSEGRQALERFRGYLLDNPRVDPDVRAALLIATGA